MSEGRVMRTVGDAHAGWPYDWGLEADVQRIDHEIVQLHMKRQYREAERMLLAQPDSEARRAAFACAAADYAIAEFVELQCRLGQDYRNRLHYINGDPGCDAWDKEVGALLKKDHHLKPIRVTVTTSPYEE